MVRKTEYEGSLPLSVTISKVACYCLTIIDCLLFLRESWTSSDGNLLIIRNFSCKFDETNSLLSLTNLMDLKALFLKQIWWNSKHYFFCKFDETIDLPTVTNLVKLNHYLSYKFGIELTSFLPLQIWWNYKYYFSCKSEETLSLLCIFDLMKNYYIVNFIKCTAFFNQVYFFYADLSML